MTKETRHSRETFDVLLLGAGLAGLTAAALIARAGLSVLVIDRAAPKLDQGDPEADLRTTALLEPTIAILRRAGAWDRVSGRAAPLRAMRMVEAGGRENRARLTAVFDAEDLERPAFGANIANPDLRAGLLAAAAEIPGLTIKAPARLEQLLLRDDAALGRLSDGTAVAARLVVGADGRDSAVRAAAGLPARRFDYGQTAMAFMVSHDADHDGVSTEILREGGPFTLVPFRPGPDGRPRSSVVWMERRAAADRLMALDREAFEAAATDRSLDRLGPLSLVSRRAAWPVISLLADRFHGRRAALIAEAAHVAPPIGAQGLNMSLADAAALSEILAEAAAAGRDIGAPETLARLTRARWRDVASRIAATAALNGAAIGGADPVRRLRQAGLALVHGLPPLRKAAMRFGLGG